MSDSICLWITDETFNEIQRNEDEESRRHSLRRAQAFNKILYNEADFQSIKALVQRILPNRTASEKSDINQVSIAAASHAQVFSTKDEGILKNAEAIERAFGIKVSHPVSVIVNASSEFNAATRSPETVSGLGLRWRPLGESDLNDDHFYRPSGESKAKLREAILSYLARPSDFSVQILDSHGEALVCRVVGRENDSRLEVPLLRISKSDKGHIGGEFAVCDLLEKAVRENRNVIKVSQAGLPERLVGRLGGLGFIQCSGFLLRIVVPQVCGRAELLDLIDQRSRESKSSFPEFDDLQLEKVCGPVFGISGISNLIIPIKPTFAMGLIDRLSASEDLFGSDPTVLLRMENVYYRTNTFPKMLKAPARIFWYVSDPEKSVIAVSHLDEVISDFPKVLFRRFRRYGVLEWRDLWEICKKEVDAKIMAIKFSETFTFPNRVGLDELRRVFEDDGRSFQIQGPMRVSEQIAENIFRRGFP